MKIIATVARYLLGLAFVVFGSNGIFPFIPTDPKQMPTGLAGDFIHALNSSHYMQAVSALMVLSGLLLLINRFVPLALTILGPILFNILLFHILLAPPTIVPGLICTVLWAVVTVRVWPAFSALVKPTGQS
ncbi:MAG: hypothetical protein WCE75_13010 [Terracidiphilus sp.]